ncbi:hypothetical protein P2U84_001684, partial [Campylobacter coli]|nr:hypothetical protein [Campylobacter coli]
FVSKWRDVGEFMSQNEKNFFHFMYEKYSKNLSNLESSFSDFMKEYNLKKDKFNFLQKIEFRKEILSQFENLNCFKNLSPLDFYKKIFKFELQEKDKFKNGDCNAIVSIMSYDKNLKYRGKQYMVKRDLEFLNFVLQRFKKQSLEVEKLFNEPDLFDLNFKELKNWRNRDFVIISSCGYMGSKKNVKRVRECYELCIDVDYIDLKTLPNLIRICEQNILPSPTLITFSGNGLHLHYVFKQPLAIENRHNQKILNDIKRVLTKFWWNKFIVDQKKSVQYQSIFQSFRMVGTFTKNAFETLGFEFKDGKEYDKNDLNDFLNYKQFREFAEFKEWKITDKISWNEAKTLYPQWALKKEIKKENKEKKEFIPDSQKENPRAKLYEWWLNKLKNSSEVLEGHRYFCIYTLAVFAKKSNISRETLERDAFSLKAKFNALGHEFSDEDIKTALYAFNKKESVLLTARHLSEITGIEFKKKKAPQGLSRLEALELANLALKYKRERQALEKKRLEAKKAKEEAEYEASLKFAILPKKPKREQKLRKRDALRREQKRQKLLNKGGHKAPASMLD